MNLDLNPGAARTLVWLLLASAACSRAGAEPPPKSPPMSLQRAVEQCTEAAHAREPSLEVHSVAHYVARGNRVIGVAVTIREAPELAACLKKLPSRPMLVNPSAAAADGAESLAVGGFAVDLGGPRPPAVPADFPALVAARRAELRVLVRKLIERGSVRDDDPLVRELLGSERSEAR